MGPVVGWPRTSRRQAPKCRSPRVPRRPVPVGGVVVVLSSGVGTTQFRKGAVADWDCGRLGSTPPKRPCVCSGGAVRMQRLPQGPLQPRGRTRKGASDLVVSVGSGSSPGPVGRVPGWHVPGGVTVRAPIYSILFLRSVSIPLPSLFPGGPSRAGCPGPSMFILSLDLGCPGHPVGAPVGADIGGSGWWHTRWARRGDRKALRTGR